MNKKLEPETLYGGLAAFIAGIAIVIEMFSNGLNQASIAGAIKDFSTTIVALIVLVVAVRKLKPKKEIETFESMLSKELDKWEKRNSPLICKAKDFPRTDTPKNIENDSWCRSRYYLLTDLEKIISEEPNEELMVLNSKNSGDANGRFVEIPVDFTKDIIFHLNKSTFKQRMLSKNKSFEEICDELTGSFSNSISKKFSHICIAKKGKEKISVRLNDNINYDTELAQEIVRMINHMYSLYTITC